MQEDDRDECEEQVGPVYQAGGGVDTVVVLTLVRWWVGVAWCLGSSLYSKSRERVACMQKERTELHQAAATASRRAGEEGSGKQPGSAVTHSPIAPWIVARHTGTSWIRSMGGDRWDADPQPVPRWRGRGALLHRCADHRVQCSAARRVVHRRRTTPKGGHVGHGRREPPLIFRLGTMIGKKQQNPRRLVLGPGACPVVSLGCLLGRLGMPGSLLTHAKLRDRTAM